MLYGRSRTALDDPGAEKIRVIQEAGSEHGFSGEYHDDAKTGIYVNILSGEPLFASCDKYASGCKWLSFTRPIVSGNIKVSHDLSPGMSRAEVRSIHGNQHLGHVFPDGPAEWGGLRYCINPIFLRFVHRNNMANEGYGEYLNHIEEVY